jgi:hypothetical protein
VGVEVVDEQEQPVGDSLVVEITDGRVGDLLCGPFVENLFIPRR